MPHHVKAALFGMSGEPNFFVDITDNMDKKIESVSVHLSQTPEFGTRLADRIRQMAQAVGEMSEEKFEYAEAYRADLFQGALEP